MAKRRRQAMFYPSSQGRCTECRNRGTVWRFSAFDGTSPLPWCRNCLIRLFGIDRLRKLVALGLIAIVLPPKGEEEQSTLFPVQHERKHA